MVVLDKVREGRWKKTQKLITILHSIEQVRIKLWFWKNCETSRNFWMPRVMTIKVCNLIDFWWRFSKIGLRNYSLNQNRKSAPPELNFVFWCFFGICQCYGVKMFPSRDIKCCYLQEKRKFGKNEAASRCITMKNFITALAAIMWYTLTTLQH